MAYRTNQQKLGVGDPGLFGFLGGIAKKVAGGLIGASPLGRIIQATVGTVAGPTVRPVLIQERLPDFTMPGGGRGGRGPLIIEPGAAAPGGRPLISRAFGQKKRRRMDPLNVKALRRSTRRLAAFQREAKKVEKELRKLAPPARRRSSRRDLGPHHEHVR